MERGNQGFSLVTHVEGGIQTSIQLHVIDPVILKKFKGKSEWRKIYISPSLFPKHCGHVIMCLKSKWVYTQGQVWFLKAISWFPPHDNNSFSLPDAWLLRHSVQIQTYSKVRSFPPWSSVQIFALLWISKFWWISHQSLCKILFLKLVRLSP